MTMLPGSYLRGPVEHMPLEAPGVDEWAANGLIGMAQSARPDIDFLAPDMDFETILSAAAESDYAATPEGQAFLQSYAANEGFQAPFDDHALAYEDGDPNRQSRHRVPSQPYGADAYPGGITHRMGR